MNNKKIKLFTILFIAFISFAILLNIGLSFAWFTKSASYDNDITFKYGDIKINANEESCFSASLSAIKPGDALLGDDIAFNITSTSQPAYIRAKLTASTTESLTNGSADKIIYDSLVSKFASLTTSTGMDYKWIYRNGYYYLMNNNGTIPLQADKKTSGYYKFLSVTNSTVDPDLEYDAKTVNKNDIKINLSIQAIQVSNIDATTSSSCIVDIERELNSLFS